jgi:hypothetical protein
MDWLNLFIWQSARGPAGTVEEVCWSKVIRRRLRQSQTTEEVMVKLYTDAFTANDITSDGALLLMEHRSLCKILLVKKLLCIVFKGSRNKTVKIKSLVYPFSNNCN